MCRTLKNKQIQNRAAGDNVLNTNLMPELHTMARLQKANLPLSKFKLSFRLKLKLKHNSILEIRCEWRLQRSQLHSKSQIQIADSNAENRFKRAKVYQAVGCRALLIHPFSHLSSHSLSHPIQLIPRLQLMRYKNAMSASPRSCHLVLPLPGTASIAL